MRGIGDEPLLAGECGVEAFEHVVKRVGQFFQLVFRTSEGEALAEVLFGSSSRGLGDDSDWSEHPA